MLNKTWDIPAMLEDYTDHLTVVFAALIKKLVPSIIGGHMSAGNKQLRADPENILAVTTADFLDDLPPSARLVANMVLPRIQEAVAKAGIDPGRFRGGLRQLFTRSRQALIKPLQVFSSPFQVFSSPFQVFFLLLYYYI